MNKLSAFLSAPDNQQLLANCVLKDESAFLAEFADFSFEEIVRKLPEFFPNTKVNLMATVRIAEAVIYVTRQQKMARFKVYKEQVDKNMEWLRQENEKLEEIIIGQNPYLKDEFLRLPDDVYVLTFGKEKETKRKFYRSLAGIYFTGNAAYVASMWNNEAYKTQAANPEIGLYMFVSEFDATSARNHIPLCEYAEGEERSKAFSCSELFCSGVMCLWYNPFSQNYEFFSTEPEAMDFNGVADFKDLPQEQRPYRRVLHWRMRYNALKNRDPLQMLRAGLSSAAMVSEAEDDDNSDADCEGPPREMRKRKHGAAEIRSSKTKKSCSQEKG